MLKNKILSAVAAASMLLVAGNFTSCNNPANSEPKPQEPEKTGFYSVDADLSCWINAMGGQEFGKSVFKGITIIEETDNSYSAVLALGKGAGDIYGVPFEAFIDSRLSIPGYYDADGNVIDAEFSVSKTEKAQAAANADYGQVAEEVFVVDGMKIPVSKDVSEYILWVYVNSNIMGVQFCDGNGDAFSQNPGKATEHVAKLTINWDTLKITSEKPSFTSLPLSTIYGNGYSFGKAGHVITINEDKTVSYSMGAYGSYSGTWTSKEVTDSKLTNCTDFDFVFTSQNGKELETDKQMKMSYRIRVINEDYIDLINTSKNSITLAKKVENKE